MVAYLEERQEELGFGVRVTVLGHVQRGGAPSAFDRLLATRLGAAAVIELKEGRAGNVVGLVGSEIKLTPLAEAPTKPKRFDMGLYELSKLMEK